MGEILKTIVDTLAKGWRISFACALASAVLLFGPTSWHPLLDKVRAQYGVLALVVLLVCGFHVATFMIDGVRDLTVSARRWRRERRRIRALLSLTDAEKELLAGVREGSYAVVEHSTHPAVRTLLMKDVLAYKDLSHRIETAGCIVYQVTDWALAALRKDPWLLDVVEHEGAPAASMRR